MISDSHNLQRLLGALNRDHQQEMTMGQRIRAADISTALNDAGHAPTETVDGDWDPGHRAKQVGPRLVHVFYDGPGEKQALGTFMAVLREADYHVVAEQHGNHRLAVTKP